MELDRQSGIPYYIQMKEFIRGKISSGLWSAGMKLPTERELAHNLGVSRNTVSQAYKELEREGILRSSQGRGTFVADDIVPVRQEGRKEKVLKIIDLAMEEAVGLGFNLDDFISFAYVRGLEKKEMLSRTKVGFVECNPEQLAECRWPLGPGVNLIPFMYEPGRDYAGEELKRFRERLGAMDMIVTGEEHLPEITSLLKDVDVPILGLALQARMETMMRIARLNVQRDVVLVCQSRRFGEKVGRTLEQAGLRLNLTLLVQPGEGGLKKILPDYEAVIVAPGMRPLVEGVLPEHMEIIEFRFEPDGGSLNFLRSTLLEWRGN